MLVGIRRHEVPVILSEPIPSIRLEPASSIFTAGDIRTGAKAFGNEMFTTD